MERLRVNILKFVIKGSLDFDITMNISHNAISGINADGSKLGISYILLLHSYIVKKCKILYLLV